MLHLGLLQARWDMQDRSREFVLLFVLDTNQSRTRSIVVCFRLLCFSKHLSKETTTGAKNCDCSLDGKFLYIICGTITSRVIKSCIVF